MTLAPGLFPSDEACVRLEQLGFDVADDHGETDYVRFPFGETHSGLIYASHVPISWGVYWRGVESDASIAWTRSLDTALELLILVQ